MLAHEGCLKDQNLIKLMVDLKTYVLYNKSMSPTTRQRQVLDFISDFQARQGIAPTVREICAGLGLASPGSLLKHLRALEREGLLNHTPGRMRAWQVVGRSPGATIPVIGRIAAGSPVLAEENREEDILIDAGLFGGEDLFALRVEGDSMIEAHIQAGDLAVIRPQAEADNGQIAAVMIEGTEYEATLKIIRRYDQTLELRAANPAYEPFLFHGPDRARVSILGRLVGVIRASIP